MARSPHINKEMKEERNKKILSGALRLFAKRGLSATKISDIARETAMSQGLIYHYYASKECIYTELIRTAFDRLIEACYLLKSMQGTPQEKIVIAIEGLLRGLTEHEDTALYHLLIAQATVSDVTPEETRAVIEERNTVPYQVISGIMEEGQRDGTIINHDARELSVLFWTTINGLAIYKSSHGAASATPDISIITRIFFTKEQ
jgi:AcrR family transcriptional regulator